MRPPLGAGENGRPPAPHRRLRCRFNEAPAGSGGKRRVGNVQRRLEGALQ